jgi:hypothetical protein
MSKRQYKVYSKEFKLEALRLASVYWNGSGDGKWHEIQNGVRADLDFTIHQQSRRTSPEC